MEYHRVPGSHHAHIDPDTSMHIHAFVESFLSRQFVVDGVESSQPPAQALEDRKKVVLTSDDIP